MGHLLIILIFGFIFYKIYKYVRRLQRFMDDPMSFFTGASNNRRTYEPEPKVRSKKFSGDDGEYVEFTDVACDVKEKSSTENVSYRVEEQITDIEWVDIEEEKK